MAQLGEDLDSSEFSEWAAYDRIHPLPDPWLQTGVICSLIANLGKSAKDRKKYKPADFMPTVKKQRKQMTTEEFRAAMIMMSRQAQAAPSPPNPNSEE